MLKNLLNLIFTDTGKDTAIVAVGTFVNVITGGIFFILAPRILGAENYGLFSTVLATGILANNIANFGIDTGIIRFAKKTDKSFNKIVSLAFKSYLVLGLSVALIGFAISPVIANFLGQTQLAGLFRIAFGANILLLLTNFYTAVLQAKGEFAKSSIVAFSSNVARLIILIVASYMFSIGLYFMTSLFFLVTAVSVIFGAIYLPIKFEKIESHETSKFFKYNFWIALTLIIPSIPFDNYLLIKLAGPLQAGLYAAPFKILTFVYQFSGNFSRVLAPRFVSFDTNEKAKKFTTKTIPMVSIFLAGLIILIFLSKPIINILFGDQYSQSVIVMQLLSLGFIFFFATIIPSTIILYYFGSSKTSFSITLFITTLFLILLLILIPQYKAQGAALAFALSQIAGFLTSVAYVLFKFKKV